jgi:nitrogen fixation protein NifU and related proteins
MNKRAAKPRTGGPVVNHDIEAIYQENILDHYRHPHNFGSLPDATFGRREANYSCGDEVEFFVKLDGRGKVAEARFQGKGCAISQAATSMLTESILGLSRSELEQLAAEDVMKLLGVTVGPSRLRCATLGLKALQAGLSADGRKSK